MNVYDFTVKKRDGSEESLSKYQGKVLLIVNSATACGFTPQYNELEDIYAAYKEKGLEILDFPCNQFGEQAPGTDAEINSFCTLKYGIEFPQYSKIDVKGEKAIPLYQWLTENTKFEGFDKLHPLGIVMTQMLKKQDKDFARNSSVKWNFTKFLIDRKGNIAARFEPTASMKKVKAKIEELL